MLFVNFHGSFGIKYQPWLDDLKKNLKEKGFKLVAPEYPSDDWDEVTKLGPGSVKRQSLINWLEAFDQIYKNFPEKEAMCFIGHSLGPLFILHIVDKYNIELDSAIFIAPFMKELKSSWQIYEANKSFYKADFDFAKLKKLIPLSYVFYSDNDPFVPQSYSIEFAEKLGSEKIFCKGMGHFNSITEFPQVFDLCKRRASEN